MPEGASQDLLNVNLGIGGVDVHKREGYGLFQTLGSTQPIHGGFHFQQVGGNDVQLWGSSTTLYSSVNDAAFVAIATGTLGATWQCADSQGSAYCVTSARDSLVKTDGTSGGTSYPTGPPLGTMVAFTPIQLVIAGVSGNESTLYISSQNAFTGFTPNVLPSSPFSEPIASPGSRITHIAYYFGKLFWWKDQSFGYATFTNQFDWQLTIVSNQIGTLDNSDAFWNSSGFDSGSKFTGTAQAAAEQSPGGIFFRGQDNHIYVYDGYYLTRISRVITPTITVANRKKANSWTQTTTADFNTGSSTNVNTSGDQLTLSYFTDNFSSLSNWIQAVNTWTVSNNIVQSPSVANYSALMASTSLSGLAPSGYRVGIYGSWQLGGPSVSASINIGIVNTSTQGYVATFGENPSTGKTQAQFIKITGSLNGSGDTILGSPADASTNADTNFHYFEIGFNQQTNALTAYYDGIAINSLTDASYTNLTNPVIRCYDQFSLTCQFQNFSIGNSTGTYYSAVHNAPNLSTWGSLAINDYVVGGSTIAYYSRSSTNSFTINSSTPSWISQTKNNIVSASTGTYFQLRSEFTLASSTQTTTIYDFAFNWNEGSASDKAYMTYFNDAVWFAVSAGTATSTNNRIFYWDILNAAWVIYDIPANGFAVENNNLYLASPTGPYVYKFGGVPTDNGNAINCYWRSRSVLGSDPFVQNEYVQADFVLGESSTSLTYTYTLDSSTSTAFVMSAYDSKASLIQRNFLLPVGKIGKYYDFTIGDNSSAQAWRMMGHRIHYNALNWRPVLQ